jgi:hypothetical protein
VYKLEIEVMDEFVSIYGQPLDCKIWQSLKKVVLAAQPTNNARNEINALIIEIYGVVPAERSYSREEVINYLQRALTSPIA